MIRKRLRHLNYVLLATSTILIIWIFGKLGSRFQSEASCRWEFVSYTPSALELTWFTHAADWGEKPCERVDQFSGEVLPWLAFTTEKPPRAKEALVPAAMSRFTYRSTCIPFKTLFVPIEPLFGPLRHPDVCSGADLVDRSYIYIDWQLPAAFVEQPAYQSAKSLYFDLGASTWTTGTAASSQNWIVEEFEKKGILFDSIWAWESMDLNQSQVWNEIPERYVPAYHWFNIPANADENSHLNPLNILARVASKDDFVVLKIDIDNADLENAFMNQIRNNKTLLSLIDEMFFEPHYKMDPLQLAWGPQTTLFKDVIELFTEIRKAGVRLHAWI
jgi:hypothetical protein